MPRSVHQPWMELPNTMTRAQVDAHWKRVHGAYYQAQRQLLHKLVGTGRNVLEIGCGTGDLLASLNPSHGVGVDVDPDIIAHARQHHPELEFHTMDAHQLDLGGRTFDVVVMVDLVGELRDLWAAFHALRKVVHPRTQVIITYYNFLWQPLLELAQSLGLKRQQQVQNWFALQDVQGLLELNGFERVASGDTLLFPAQVPLVGPLVNRVVSPAPAVHHLNLLQYMVARPGPGFDAPAQPLSVSVIIPARNERGNIRPAIRRTPLMGTSTELLFVEGGSQDGTPDEIAQAMAEEKTPCTVRSYTQTGKGKADAVRLGFQHARGDVVMILDADLSVQPEDLPRFHLAIAQGRADYVQGSRLVYQMEDQAMRLLNLAANHFFGAAFSYVLNQPIKDTLCGTKVMRRQDWERVDASRHIIGVEDPFGDFDLLFGAARLGLRIREIPVRYFARTYGTTQIDRFRHGLMLFRMLGAATRFFKLDG